MCCFHPLPPTPKPPPALFPNHPPLAHVASIAALSQTRSIGDWCMELPAICTGDTSTLGSTASFASQLQGIMKSAIRRLHCTVEETLYTGGVGGCAQSISIANSLFLPQPCISACSFVSSEEVTRRRHIYGCMKCINPRWAVD